MAVSLVQRYLNLAFSLTAGNKSGTDISYSLPNDLRKYSDLKIKDIKTQRQEIEYHASTETEITRIGADDIIFVLASHPITISHLNGTDIGVGPMTSFFGIARDRDGGYGATATTLKLKNNLSGPNFNSAGAGSTVEVLIVQVEFE